MNTCSPTQEFSVNQSSLTRKTSEFDLNFTRNLVAAPQGGAAAPHNVVQFIVRQTPPHVYVDLAVHIGTTH
jgi:hypothetical protein